MCKKVLECGQCLRLQSGSSPPLPPVGKIYIPSKREVNSRGQNSIFTHQKRGGGDMQDSTQDNRIQRDFLHLSHRRNLILYSIFYLANKGTTLARAGIVSHLQERHRVTAPHFWPSDKTHRVQRQIPRGALMRFCVKRRNARLSCNYW